MEDRTASDAVAAAAAAAAAVAVAAANTTTAPATAVSTPTAISAPNGSVYQASPINHSQSLPASETQSPMAQLPPLSQTQQATPTMQNTTIASTMQPIFTPTPATDAGSRGPGTPTSATTTTGQMPNFAAAAAAAAAVVQTATTQAAARNAVYSLAAAPSQYPPPQAYTSSMMSQTTPAISHPQPIAPAPTNRNVPPSLRPISHQGVLQPGITYGAGLLPHTLPEGEPTHVVGSQGRRGILPSAPGRPSVSQMGAKGTIIPQKDADGKFPCPHCTKTYLHAKHLKRHLLRHTGDRPYMCVLCRDTFSRSDILKRHFQKCSIRRGNPTGVSHLSHPQAHVKKNQQKQAALADAGDMAHLNGLGAIQDGMVHPFGTGMVPVTNPLGALHTDQITGTVMATGTRPGFDQSYATDVSVTMSGQSITNYSMATQAGGLPMYGANAAATQQSGLDWDQIFQPGAQNLDFLFSNSLAPNTGRQTQTVPRQDNKGNEDVVHALNMSSPESESSRSSSDDKPRKLKRHDTFLELQERITASLYPSGSDDGQPQKLKEFFTPTNIKDFLSSYSHFHIHFPLLHAPTFRVTSAITPLLIALCCVGATYSDRVTAAEVREMMQGLRSVLERDCRLFPFRPEGPKEPLATHCASKNDIEELQALLLFCTMCTWHGSPEEREFFTQHRSSYLECIQACGVMKISGPGEPGYSVLHQPEFSAKNFDESTFDWESWVNQEQRVRFSYVNFLGSVGWSLFYNYPIEFDCFDFALPMPTDDEAWDARDKDTCLAALGLKGDEAAKKYNPDGTQRARQPDMPDALRSLMHSGSQIQPGSTNLYGKFILIHAILSLICDALREQVSIADLAREEALNADPSIILPPDCEEPATLIPHDTLRAIYTALDKFKANWDMDMVTQFPPSGAKMNPRRHGFVRDGIHFYWVCKYLLKYTRADDFRCLGETRLRQVMGWLKTVKSWVLSDGASRGEELGSVGEIGEYDQPIDDAFNMADLFRPLQDVIDDPRVATVETNLSDSGTEPDTDEE
ncbi:hypothetical protein TD95_003209 [Thielaviopsis punctulata]|uniref:C2H2-type domain-containing protein n=1 Tax=Thielaviopsis punctulata TaxID=72032 RepID=A0A0F4Z9Y8_9PEZI|nr:hypothetical protein TD95_003209 [Thielaviopsis punctulata]